MSISLRFDGTWQLTIFLGYELGHDDPERKDVWSLIAV